MPLGEWGIDIGKWADEIIGDVNKEIDTNELGKDLDIECPKCHFKFKKDVQL